jgi:hypothetical protein
LEEALAPPTLIILRGPAADLPDWQRRLTAYPSAITLALPNGTSGLPPPLAKPETPVVNAWVCQGVKCLAPIADFAALEGVLQAG